MNPIVLDNEPDNDGSDLAYCLRNYFTSLRVCEYRRHRDSKLSASVWNFEARVRMDSHWQQVYSKSHVRQYSVEVGSWISSCAVVSLTVNHESP